MSVSAANTLWARSFVDELARSGVSQVALAPGSRSTPLVLALAADGRFRIRVHLDERSAAFFAVGIGKSATWPSAVVTTSGTAAANVFPAVVEASQSETPLLVLTADRPHRLRDSDANQAIDQVRMYGRYVRASFDVAPPSIGGPALRHLRALACRSVAAAVGPPPGPVHVNFPFEKPLEPTELPPDFVAQHPLAATGRPDGEPFVRFGTNRLVPTPDEVTELTDHLEEPRGVIVAGPTPTPGVVGPAVLRLAAKTGYPVLADPLSGARYGRAGGAHRVAAYDLFLADGDVADALAPTLIVRVGASPTSAALQRWIGHHNGVRYLVIDPGDRYKDHGATATGYFRANPAPLLDAATRTADYSASDAWVDGWRTAEAAALEALDDTDDDHEGSIVATVLRTLPDGGTLFVSSSMPVRDLDAFGHPRDELLHVFGNRGASGIDGIVSTAFGVASQRARPTVCVLGDIAFFHDQNGLLWSREDDAVVVFVLIDNDGGGIFQMLPVAEHEPDFTEYFATPHGLDLAHAAALHGIEVVDSSLADVRADVAEAQAAEKTVVVRVKTERAANHARHVQVREAVCRSVRQALNRESRSP
jgi:2-succinyl-5-enolpyruvyl-6-hydroxy-3-cyclohexene-1-carboxylate synthase